MSQLIYVIEDDESIRELIKVSLESFSYRVEAFETAEDGLDAIGGQLPDMALFDLMLPKMDGLSAIKELRKNPKTHDLPIIILTAKGTEIDKVMGLDGGADDYLSKPFGMMEMVSRTRALLRRAGREQPHAESQSLAAGELMLWPDRREATVEGRELSLTMREFDLLEFLMRSPGVVFSRETLLQRVWGWDFDGGSRTVDVHVQQIRAKLGERSDLIETVRGVGYRVRG